MDKLENMPEKEEKRIGANMYDDEDDDADKESSPLEESIEEHFCCSTK